MMTNKYADNLREHADKNKLWPGDNDFADAAAEIDRLEAKVIEINRVATDRQYMMWAYYSMLGVDGVKVADAWEAKRVKRVHHSWGPDAAKMTGEERAAYLLQWMEAEKTAVLVEDIDSHLA